MNNCISIKKAILMLFVLVLNFSVTAQRGNDDEVNKSFFKKENLFTGGSVNANFGAGTLALGLGPYFGYSINKYVDVAASFNYNYVSQRDPNSTLKYRQSIIGPGAFVRLFPINGFFAQAQYEFNFIKLKRIYGVAGYPDDVLNFKAKSTLVGGGYCSGRQGVGSGYYYFSLLVDVSNDIYSPYKDNYGRKNPIIRAGMNFPLFQGKNKPKFSDD
jgi:hypothetical protein